jgi:hypothetical protein
MQGRFNHLADQDIEAIQQNVEKTWNKLVKRAES